MVLINLKARMRISQASLFLTVAATFLQNAQADVTLPPLISDNMLLQRAHAAVWGKADPGEAVTVQLGQSVAKTTADAQGRWRVALDGLRPGVAGEMTISAKNTLTVHNVAVGDVWVCSGQSNMQMGVVVATGLKGVNNFQQEISAADYPLIRMFSVPRTGSDTPLEEVNGKWEVCTPATVSTWSAVGYFFGRQLHRDLQLPIGLIHSSWGGSFAQAWTPREILQGDPELSAAYLNQKPLAERQAEYLALKEKYEKEQIPAWSSAVKAAQAEGKPQPPKPVPPNSPYPGGISCTLYNAMIAGATKYPITGAIWYQGESNAGDAVRYRRLLPAMIDAWRKAWGQEFPFYIVQLANYMARTLEPMDAKWADLREAQRLTAQNHPHCGLAVAIDIGEADNIHPTNKQEVGRRLALAAEAKTYGKQIVSSGPDLANVKFDGANVLLEFKPGTALGLAASDATSIKGFALAGEDKKFYWAEARIVAPTPQKASQPGNPQEPTLTLHCPEVPKPVAVRYAWANNPEVNLVNGAGLPAVPFRTDNWPQVERPVPAVSPATAAGVPAASPAATPK